MLTALLECLVIFGCAGLGLAVAGTAIWVVFGHIYRSCEGNDR